MVQPQRTAGSPTRLDSSGVHSWQRWGAPPEANGYPRQRGNPLSTVPTTYQYLLFYKPSKRHPANKQARRHLLRHMPWAPTSAPADIHCCCELAATQKLSRRDLLRARKQYFSPPLSRGLASAIKHRAHPRSGTSARGATLELAKCCDGNLAPYLVRAAACWFVTTPRLRR